MWLNRTVCDMIREARQCYETRNFSHLLGLLEEIQSAVNRMEAGLDQKRDYEQLREETKRLFKKKRKLERQIEKLEEKVQK